MKERLPLLRPLPPLLAGVLVVLGEHVWRANAVRPYLSGLALALLLAAFGWNLAAAWRWEREPEGRGRSGWSPVWAPALFLVAAACYGISLALPAVSAPGAVDWAALLGWGWALALTVGAVLFLFTEAALLAQLASPRKEGLRLRLARNAGLTLGMVLALIVTLNFIFASLPWQWDLGYFKSAQPSAATRHAAEGLTAPIEVALFYPSDNAVGGLLRDYFAALKGASSFLQVAEYDSELHPKEARRLSVRGNGTVVLSKEGVNRTIPVDPDLEQAREALTKFDSTFLGELNRLTREKRVAYLTVGHGERNEAAEAGVPRFTRVEGLRQILQGLNFDVKPLGLSQGLGTDVPEDAKVVLIIGPAAPFQQVELDALQRYLERGGRLMIFLEPDIRAARSLAGGNEERSAGLRKLLAKYGAEYSPVLEANDRIYGRRTQTRADYALLATARYMFHPSVADLRRNANQFPLLFLAAGSWNKGKAPPSLRVDDTIKGMPGTWNDINGNFQFDGGEEKRGEPILALAISRRQNPQEKKGSAEVKAPEESSGPDLRILAFADADVASDLFIQNQANELAMVEGVSWLVGDESAVGLPEAGQDLKIQHVKGDELIWFYLPVFAVPLLVLIIGFAISRYRSGRTRGGNHA